MDYGEWRAGVTARLTKHEKAKFDYVPAPSVIDGLPVPPDRQWESLYLPVSISKFCALEAVRNERQQRIDATRLAIIAGGSAKRRPGGSICKSRWGCLLRRPALAAFPLPFQQTVAPPPTSGVRWFGSNNWYNEQSGAATVAQTAPRRMSIPSVSTSAAAGPARSKRRDLYMGKLPDADGIVVGHLVHDNIEAVRAR